MLRDAISPLRAPALVSVAMLPGGPVRVRLMGMLGLQKAADAPGKGDTEEEGERQPKAVMGMEGNFGQEVGQRNAQKHAGGEGEGAANGDLLVGEQARQAADERDRPERTHDGERDVGQPNVPLFPTPRSHQRCDRQRIERLMQRDGKKSSQAEQGEAMLLVGFGRHRRAQRDAIDQRMQ